MDKIKFNNGKLTVLQISDAQDLHWVRKTMVKMLCNACDRVRPDLIIFTGDNILGNHICDRRFGSKTKNMTRDEEYATLKKALGHILNIASARNIPFAAIFGNHDDRNSFTKDEQADIFREYPQNRGFINRGELCGNDCLPVYSSDVKSRVMNLWMTDTARYDKENDKCYTEITKQQVEWFKKESDSLKRENGGKPYPSIMFMHIPFEKTGVFCTECNKENSSFEKDGKYYKLADSAFGSLNEPTTGVRDDYGFYDEVLNDGGVKAIVSGHHHLNCFEGKADSVRFIATPGASFRSYGNRLRGVRVFEIYENDIENFDTYTLNYTDLCGDGLSAKFGWFWDADNMEIIKAKTLSVAAAASMGILAAAVKKIHRNRKNENKGKR